MVEYTIENNTLHIVNSALVSKKTFWKELANIYVDNNDCPVFDRTITSLLNEWAAHNALYSIGMFKSHTKDVDLNYPQKWYEKIGYAIFGTIVWPFIK